jgi:hypothetical protein
MKRRAGELSAANGHVEGADAPPTPIVAVPAAGESPNGRDGAPGAQPRRRRRRPAAAGGEAGPGSAPPLDAGAVERTAEVG